METYGKILVIAMPIFLLLVLLEKLYGVMTGKETYRNMDMISSLSSGVTNVVKDVLGLSIGIISYGWMVKHLAIAHVQAGWLVYLIAFLVLDFSGYWVHRINHEYNFFWNAHLIHHSSEDFNLACALRQSISVFVRMFTFLLLPAALFGVPGEVIALVGPIHLFAQFWYHTQHIRKMGILEKIIVTPSHHRVHHAINPEYLDKNYGQIFIFWDIWFGSFQEELDHVPPVYGITRPVSTWNPIKINFQHIWLLMKDAWHTHSWKDTWRVWIMPTGWRPADVIDRYKVNKIDDVYHFDKYNTESSFALNAWSWVQLVGLLVLTTYLFSHIALLNKTNAWYIYLYGIFIFLTVYAYTDLMDHNLNAWISELLKFSFAICVIIKTGSWFSMSQVWTILVIGYLLLSLVISLYFNFTFRASKLKMAYNH